jgi:diguanylate cyclase (GGDEF)-like protein
MSDGAREPRDGPGPARPVRGDPPRSAQETERALRAIMLLMQEGAAMLDKEGCVLHCNSQLGELLGQPRETLIGQSFGSFVDSADADKWEAAFGHRSEAAPLGFTLNLLVEGQRPIPVHLALCLLSAPLGRVALLVASDLGWQEERMRQLERVNRQLEEERERLELAATTDSATGAYASGAVFEVLETEIAYGRRYGYCVSVLIMDLDDFKSLNDSYGHAFGDTVLREFCDRCREAIRATDYLVRYGGDEFVVILPQTDARGARAVGERILNSVRGQPFTEGVRSVPVTVSMGAATALPEDGLSGGVLLKRADDALYQVKGSGRDGLASWDRSRPASDD